MHQPRRWAAVVLAAYSVLLAVVLLGPDTPASALVTRTTSLGLRAGISEGVLNTYRVEFVFNVAALMPVSALGSLAWPRWNWRDWTALGFSISSAVEFAQVVLVPERSATFVDVVANTLGAALGAIVAGGIRAFVVIRAEGRQ